MSELSSSTALIVIDVQRAFDQWEAAGKQRNNPQAVDRIADLLTAFRATGTPIFHIRHQGTRPNSSFLPGGAGYPVKDEAREVGGEPVLVKRVNSAFIGTDLERRLREADIKTLVICIAWRRRPGWPATLASTPGWYATRPGRSTAPVLMATSIRPRRSTP
jgi:nicotinamidase-related amidase